MKTNLGRYVNRPNILIVITGIVSCVLLLAYASFLKGILQDFLVNLSAGMLAIAVTVLLVDVLREHRLDAQYRQPRSMALKKIFGLNTSLALSLSLKNREVKPSILKSLVRFVNDPDNQSPDVLTKGSFSAFKELAKMDTGSIVVGYSNEELSSKLKPELQKILNNCGDISNRYMFSFNDITLRADYTGLLENLDALISSIEMVSINADELENILKPEKESVPMTLNRFVGILMIRYLESYDMFVSKYLKFTENEDE